MPQRITVGYTPGKGAEMPFTSTAATPSIASFPNVNAQVGGATSTIITVAVPAFTGFYQLPLYASLSGLPQIIVVTLATTGVLTVCANLVSNPPFLVGMPSLGLSFNNAAVKFPSPSTTLSAGVTYTSPIVSGYVNLYSPTATTATTIQLQIAAILVGTTS
jgi:hypothetical protein